MPFCPESPRFLLINKKLEADARKGNYPLMYLCSTDAKHLKVKNIVCQYEKKNVKELKVKHVAGLTS